ncbi:hypothetical protein QJ857_gp0891 [Tupanvirus soda lake]|uniref:Uncharacterized protein n=2 Tax=Tupanvirus TaxID=2094720 RepID=A0A6N1P2A9_9VIRU|nr:hypothetical protein QJ857_gp0891 [Tupanvirus soda lake]QKU35161.1 hypothetical protein [Tupanvirus soda lake]
MNKKKFIFKAKPYTNYKVIIKSDKNNFIKISFDGDPHFGSIDVCNKEIYEINYYNDKSRILIVVIEYSHPSFKIMVNEEPIQIKQIYMNDLFKLTFWNEMQKSYGLASYNNDYEPAIFYGLMTDNDVAVLEKNKSLKVIIWVGGDINYLINRTEHVSKSIKARIDRILKIPKIKHISISSFISKNLTQLSVPFKMVPFMGIDFSYYKPVPKGPCIYLYTYPCSEEYYGKDLYMRLIEKYKNIKFIATCCSLAYKNIKNNPKANPLGIKYYTKQQLIKKVYPQCFVGLRLTNHDGLSATVQELGLMGIKCIHNGCSPSALNYNSFEDICNHIDSEYKKINEVDYALALKVKEYLTISPDFFNTKFHQ